MTDELTRAQGRVDDLRLLLRQVREAREGVPSLHRAAEAVGSAGTWTGTAADRLHRDELAPAAAALPRTLVRIEEAVADELAHAERALGRAREDAEGVA
ncbi:hypothetical protein OMK64_10135 [Cellulomonas fimi]|nr:MULTISPECIES: hypothetical protein [Cellulomonas]MDC7121893.1 hypothetical protein [Cellulomonas fimi]QHT57480.1 hypothetical protein GXP71_16315 [Cellulomonas sp. H30R-01]